MEHPERFELSTSDLEGRRSTLELWMRFGWDQEECQWTAWQDSNLQPFSDLEIMVYRTTALPIELHAEGTMERLARIELVISALATPRTNHCAIAALMGGHIVTWWSRSDLN